MKKNMRSCLIIDRADFAQKLAERISLGQDLLAQQVHSDEAFLKYKGEVTKWSDYNLELFKQSFDNPENEYKQEYKDSYFPLGSLETHTLADKVDRRKKEVSHYVNGLEKILNKIDLIPVQGQV